MNEMSLLVVGSSLMKVLQVRGITGLATLRIENGVDLRMIDGIQPCEMHFDAVYVGRVDTSKGLEDLPRAWLRPDTVRNKYTFAIVGPTQESLRQKIENLEASSRGDVNFLGALTDIEVIAVLKSSGVLLLPSAFESFSLVVAEALACGIPVVAYDSPALREFFPTPAVSLVPRRDITRLVSTAKEVLGNPDEKLRLGRVGREFVSRYSWDKVATKEAEIYRNLIGKTSPQNWSRNLRNK
jgi:glycosyltransferase involved in cell wall biosynthesis